jgi:hypothetical protein
MHAHGIHSFIECCPAVGRLSAVEYIAATLRPAGLISVYAAAVARTERRIADIASSQPA